MPNHSSSDDERAFRGGGETGALMREVDWATTPLGPVALWPQSLRTAVSIVLDSKFPMYIAWGAEYVQLYNDGYRPILGSTKHPAAIGRRASDTFHESWHIIGPMFDGVRGGDAVGAEDWMLPLDRHGYLEECYFTFSYSPIRDESGEVGGVLVTVSETTGRVVGARRLRALHDLSARAVEGQSAEHACAASADALALDRADVPFALLYLLSSDGARVRLAGSMGIEAEPLGALAELDASDPLLGDAGRGEAREVEIDVRGRVGKVNAGDWPDPVVAAFSVPIAKPGDARPYGVLVAGVSPGKRLDAEYRQFFSLVAGHVSTAITSARALEEERSRSSALAEIDRAKTTFFSNVSHEFRTPLTLMLGPLEDALSHEPRALAGADLETTYRNSLRLLKLVNTLLDFSRIEAGKARLDRRPTDLAALTRDLASAFRSAVERAGLVFEVDCPPLSAPVSVDRDMWEKIVLNLLSNALKFTLQGTIRVTLAAHLDGIRLVVADTGSGLPSHELPLLFERFHRVEGAPARTHEGSGIGLALVNELVRLHGGSIEVESAEAVGTRFVVTIPVDADAASSVDQTATTQSAAVAAAPYVEEALRWLPGARRASDAPVATAQPLRIPADRSVRILVVEDNRDMRDYVSRILEERWAVEAVGDGEAALVAVRRARPDLILSDVMMPGIDGFALLRALRDDPQTQSIPVLMLSARAGDEARVEGLEAGADDYLVKPFAARELVARVATHLALGRARAEARAAHDRLRAMFLQAPLAVSVVRGDDFVYELANPEYERMVGRHGITGKPMRDVFPELPADAPVYDMLRGVRTSGEPFSAAEFPVRLDRRGDGTLEEAYFLFVTQPIRETDGSIDTILTAAVDVTAQVDMRRRIERLLAEREVLLVNEQDARRDAEAASIAKDDFLAVLGHELRNPLAPIVTGLQLLKLRNPGVNREQAIIERQVAHVVRLVDDLLDVSRIVRRKVDLRREPVELAEAVAQAAETAAPLFTERRHRLEITLPEKGVLIDGDRTRLAQIFANLLTNAGKYSSEGSVVRVDAVVTTGEVVVSVRDEGTGLAPAMVSRVFDSFVQAPQGKDRARGGLGLGLAIVRGLSELHGGAAWAASAGLGLGSTFYVRLPRMAAGEALSRPPKRAKPAMADRAKVLLVDDNDDAAELLDLALVSMGFTVVVRHDGPSALVALDEVAVDAAILDIGLPGMDGYELARRVRGDARFGALPLIALTGYGQDSDVANARAAGFTEHMTKPVDLDRLEQTLTTLLGASAASAAAPAPLEPIEPP